MELGVQGRLRGAGACSGHMAPGDSPVPANYWGRSEGGCPFISKVGSKKTKVGSPQQRPRSPQGLSPS